MSNPKESRRTPGSRENPLAFREGLEKDRLAEEFQDQGRRDELRKARRANAPWASWLAHGVRLSIRRSWRA